MDTHERIASILSANQLDSSVTNFQSFNLSDLILESDVEFELPFNLRLGHMVEKVVAELIKSSSNYNVLRENTQLIENKQTIGELDFIIEEVESKAKIHLELAYKFYLFDPTISEDPINNWIGPNRNDSLNLKLEKLVRRQFPLLYSDQAEKTLSEISVNEISQQLCFLVSLYVPYESEISYSPVFEKAIKGYYINHTGFFDLNHLSESFYIPSRKEWGMDPSENKVWEELKDLKPRIIKNMAERKSILCWQKKDETYQSYFITWW